MSVDHPAAGPFGLDISQAVCDRATRLAKALFGALDAQIVLMEGDRVWRSRDRAGIVISEDQAAQLVLQTGELLWLEDGRQDPRFANNPAVTFDFARFIAIVHGLSQS